MKSDQDEDYVDPNVEDNIDDPEDFDPNIFHIWDPLQKPITLQYTTEDLHSAWDSFKVAAPKHLSRAEMIHEGDIDLDPEYQRGM